MTTIAEVTPVKGMVFRHAKRTNYDGSPLECTVSSVGPEYVYWVHPLYQGGKRFKTPVGSFARFCAEVVSVPAPKAPKSAGPTLSAKQYQALMTEAHEAGLAAGESVRPAPMIVGSPTTPLGSDIDPTKKVYLVPDGICGFAYLETPGNTPFGRYVKGLGWRKAYRGGLFTGVRAFGQSLERKTAYARAYVEVLRAAGIDITYESRVD